MKSLLKDKWLHIFIIITAIILLSGTIIMIGKNKEERKRPNLDRAKEVHNYNHYMRLGTDKYSKHILEPDNGLKVHFIDVGDADAILVQAGNASMMIDGGNNKDSDLVKDYLHQQNISRLDVLVGTHAHEDHMGSLDDVIKSFDIGTVYLPESNSANKDLEDVINEIKKKGLTITKPVAGESFRLGDAVCTILAPSSGGYEKLNDYSIVIKLQYGNTSFLFTGDAENKSEKEMLRRGFVLSADVLKLAHHGSVSSSSSELLNRINPKYAVLMAGKDNKYRHPHKSIMNKLKEKNIILYRTDEVGTIIATSDGKNIIFNKKPGSYFYR